ncbi:MAG: bile acid:sodium symporter [Candidatus Thermoplasmatota archaeon]|nr:bile acid:sodium symporter [Candidatus Thermoplasmatota archaeon]MCL5963358.1 bile acid:sodium symporter [Candidatus Thermoplasmatota archaeon]
MSDDSGIKLGVRTLIFPVLVFISIIVGLELGIDFRSYGTIIGYYGIPIGLFFMIYPPMTKIKIEDLARDLKDIKTVSLMLFLNFVIDPFLVAGIGYFYIFYIFYPSGFLSYTVAKEVFVGIVLLGVAPCIAMVIVWIALSKGNVAMGVSFVAWTSILQIITMPIFVYVLARTSVVISPLLIAESVILYLALPLLAGVLTRKFFHRKRYFSKLVNKLNDIQIISLLFTIVVMFWTEGYGIVSYPDLILIVGLIMLTFYFLLFHIGYYVSRKLKYSYENSTAIGYTVAARNFELSIAVAISAFSMYQFIPIVTAIGPLLEIPLMILLIYVQLHRRKKIKINQKNK